MIRLLLADDHALFRSGMRSVLETARDIEVAGEVESGEAAVEHVRRDPPDLVLMDVNMPGMGGIEATRRIVAMDRGTRVIAVTALDGDPFPNRLLDAGAMGYLTKGCAAEELFEAIRKVHAGKHYLSTEVARRLALGRLVNGSDKPLLETLSPRELQVMLLVVQGHGNQYISDTLCLSPKTISTYRHRLYEKLGVSNDVELTHLAIRHGVIDPAAS